MRCEAHVRFLGGGGAAMCCRYPTIRSTKRQGACTAKKNFGRGLTRRGMSVKKQLEFTARAFRNIAAAEEFVSHDNPAAAQKVVKAIYDA